MRFFSIAKFILFLLCGMAFSNHSAVRADDVGGVWHGIGIQGSESQWSTEIDLRQKIPQVRYPSLKCSGRWEKLDGEGAYREVIEVNRPSCIDGYVRIYRLSKTRMGVEYSETQGGPLIAKAVVFPGPHHERRQRHMIEVTRAFVDGR